MVSPVDIAVMVTLLVVGGITSKLVLRRTTSLVLQTFLIARQPSRPQSPTVEIVGRMQGVVAFVLSLLGFSPITRFTIAGTEVRCQSTSLFGQRSQYIPLRCVTNFAAGVHKPIAAIVWAVIIVTGGVYASLEEGSWAPIAIALIIGIVLVVWYMLGKRFYIEVYAQDGPPISLLYTPNVIEGVPVDMDRALAVIGVIRDLVLEQGAAAAPQAGVRHVAAQPEAVGYESFAEPPDERYDEPANVPDFNVDAALEDEEESQEVRQQAEPEDKPEDIPSDVLYARARKLASSGHRDDAIKLLREIICRFPGTREAEQARRSLQQVGIRE